MNRLLYILFFLLCGGSVFFHTHSVNDGQIVSKWLLAETAACLWLLALSLRCLKADNRRKAGLNIHKYFITVLACCWMESVYGIIQALPIFHSAHSLPISGSFDNPAGFAACICAGLPFVYPFLKSKRKAVKLTALFMACCMMAACCLSQSRTGMVAVIVVTGMIVFPYIPRFKYRNSLIAMLLAGVLSMGYLFKKDSADGRLLIGRCTCEMVMDRPFTGWGRGAFTAHYMDYQANYFQTHPQSRFAMLAGNVNHPFNEYLHVCLVGGIPLLLLLVVFCAFLYHCYRRSPSLNGKAAVLSLVSVGVFSLFSYPFSYPFTWIATLLSCYVLIRQAPIKIGRGNRIKRLAAVCAACIACCLLYGQALRTEAELRWKAVTDMALQGKGEQVFPLYERLKKRLGKNPFFLYNYAAELYVAGHYERSFSVLDECREYWADYDLEILSGEVCYELRRYDEAISHFEKASYMCPVKFAPLYRCYTIYKELGIKEKSDPLAEKILNKKVKIPSREIDHMRMEIRIDRVNEQSTNQ